MWMKSMLLGVLCLSSVVEAAPARTIAIRATFDVSSEYDELDLDRARQEGWSVGEDDDGNSIYSLEAEPRLSALPFRKDLGPAYLSISKTGLVEIGMSVGDADAGGATTVQLPVVAGKLQPVSLEIESSGGDYASGVWSYRGKVAIEVK